jgi:hypothetical protein
MIELATRIPIQLNPRQTFLIVVLATAVLVAVIAGALFESVVGGLVRLVLKLTGHKPPRKSNFTRVLDDMDEQLRKR